ncbi:MAG: HEAT repeat domain-containing protein [Bryobacteraceae bacterium]
MWLLRLLTSALLLCSSLPLAAQAPADSDPKQRIRAARELARQGSGAIAKLQPMLSDPLAEVRIEAVKAILEIGTGDSLDPLTQATRDSDAEVQIRATDGLVNFYLPGYVRTGLSASLHRIGNVFTAKFTDTNDQAIDPFVEVRPEVVAALGKLAAGASTVEARANAARACGILRGRSALPDLYQALHSKDSQLIYECLVAIRKIGDPSAAPQIAFLLHDLDEKVQFTVLETTGLLRNRDALPDLRRVLSDPASNRIRRAALTAIAMIPDESSRPDYLRYFADKDDGMRAAAAEGLARLKNPSDLPLVRKAFNEERKMSPRLSQAFALVMLGQSEAGELSPLRYLVNSLNSLAWRGVARAFLIELARDPAIRRTLRNATPSAAKAEKIELADILARSGDKDTLACLEALSRDPDTEVAEAGLNASRILKARLP